MGTCSGAVVVPSSAGFHSTFFDMMPELSFFFDTRCFEINLSINNNKNMLSFEKFIFFISLGIQIRIF